MRVCPFGQPGCSGRRSASASAISYAPASTEGAAAVRVEQVRHWIEFDGLRVSIHGFVELPGLERLVADLPVAFGKVGRGRPPPPPRVPPPPPRVPPPPLPPPPL